MNKYKVSQELMNEIDRWNNSLDGWVWQDDVDGLLPFEVQVWWVDEPSTTIERNNRLIALIQYVNGEDVFEVEKPKKWVVRSKYSADKYQYYVSLKKYDLLRDSAVDVENARFVCLTYNVDWAFKFNTKEEAEKWTNPLMEAVEAADD